MQAPLAKRIPYEMVKHGDTRQDEYYWLRDKQNPEVISYLEAENAYYDTVMEPLKPVTERIFTDMMARVPQVEESVPVVHGPYYYYARLDKDLQYPIYARKLCDSRAELNSTEEEVILDVNTLAEDGDYLDVSVRRVSPSHDKLAYLENRDGSDRYTLYVKDLATGDLLSDKINGVFIHGSLEWDASGQSLFYLTMDEAQRPCRLWRHWLGRDGQDELLFEELDITFSLTLYQSQSGRFVFLKVFSKTSSEVYYLDLQSGNASLTLFQPKRPDILYALEHWGEDLLVLTNENAVNFRVQHCPIGALPAGNAKDLFPYESERFIEAICPFQSSLVIEGRQDGLTQVWLYREGTLKQLVWEEPVYTVQLGTNYDYTANEILVAYESMVTPRTTYGLDLRGGQLSLLKTAEVPGAYDKSLYRQERLFATAEDGAKVPIALVYRADAKTDGPAPTLLYAYGSYGANTDPHFDAGRIPLLDYGLVYAITQIRGGSEMGHSWYLDGKLLKKRNTFTDYIAAAKHLIATGYTSPERLAARGASAGGLLMGGVANLGGELFKVMVPGVPFVDVVTTMLDATIPLTSLEWDEWGNPEDPEYYAYMKSYSPYDNVEAKTYPHMYVTTGLNDPRVAYWEPAKWVARLRVTKTDHNQLVLKTNMGAGHFGASGRANRIRETAAMYAFVFDKIGIKVE